MTTLSRTLRDWIPPALEIYLRPLLGRSIYFKGVYPDWAAAAAQATGYDAGQILEHAKKARLRVEAGEAAYERDGVIFDETQHVFPVLSALLRCASEHANRLSVLDFGGALGSSYFQCREFLAVLDHLHWGIVEQPHFVDCGRQYFENPQLQFFDSIASCNAWQTPNLALLSSVLQYVSAPYVVLDELMQRGLQYIVIDRTPFSDAAEDCITVQYVPPKIYPASYPCWIFSRSKFMAKVLAGYELVASLVNEEGAAHAGSSCFNFEGMILRKRV